MIVCDYDIDGEIILNELNLNLTLTDLEMHEPSRRKEKHSEH